MAGKAAAIRHLAGFGVFLATRFNTGSQHDLMRLECAKLLDRFYYLLKTEDFFLSAPAVAEIKKIGPDLVTFYNFLSHEAVASDQKYWKVHPKFHMWLHLTETQAGLMNPRMFWCYADEDLVGQAMEVMRSVHVSTAPDTGLYKWLVLHFGVGCRGCFLHLFVVPCCFCFLTCLVCAMLFCV